MRKIFFIIFILLFLGSVYAAPIRLVIVGDNRPSDDSLTISSVYTNLIRKINLLNPDYVFNTGDMIMGYTEDTIKLKEQWNSFINASSALLAPYYLVPGNHDVQDSVSLSLYNRYCGKTMYKDSVDNRVYFIVLNSEETFGDDTLSFVQRDFLKNSLEQLPDSAIAFIFIHKPLWKYDKNGVGFWSLYVDPIIKPYKDKVKAVVAGHMHNYQYESRYGVNYFISGGGGGPLREAEAFGAFHHILLFTIKDDNSVDVLVLKDDGMLAKDDIKPGTMDMWYNLRRTAYGIPVSPKDNIKFYLRNTIDSTIVAKCVLEKDGIALTDTQYITMNRGNKDTLVFKNKAAKDITVINRPYLHIFYDTPFGVMDYKKDIAWSPKLKNGSVIKLQGDKFLVKGKGSNKEGYFKIYEKDSFVIIEAREIDTNGKKMGDWYLTDGLLISLGKEKDNGKRKYIGTLYLSELFDNNVKFLHFKNMNLKNKIKVNAEKVSSNTILYTIKLPKDIARKLLIDFAMIDTNNGKDLSWWDYTGNSLIYKNSSYMAYYDIR